eukprot:3541311-Prymnesium_polylepis.1
MLGGGRLSLVFPERKAVPPPVRPSAEAPKKAKKHGGGDDGGGGGGKGQRTIDLQRRMDAHNSFVRRLRFDPPHPMLALLLCMRTRARAM